MSPPHLSLLAVLIPVVGLWLLALVITPLYGWRNWARAYPAPSRAPHVRFLMRSGYVGRARYGSALNLGVSNEGLHLSVPLLFRIGHPPVVVPWSDISVVGKRGSYSTWVEYQFAKVPKSTLRIRKDVAEAISRASGGALTLPEGSRVGARLK